MTENKITDTVLARMRASGGIIAIDGRCAAGKTTLARVLSQRLECPVFHMDDFFLPAERRRSEVAGNIDFERLEREVLIPFSSGKAVCYRPFDCRAQTLGEGMKVSAGRAAILEGSYSTHPRICSYSYLKIFMSIDPDTQKERILAREGEAALERFEHIWIPAEERYFAAFDIEKHCDIVF